MNVEGATALQIIDELDHWPSYLVGVRSVGFIEVLWLCQLSAGLCLTFVVDDMDLDPLPFDDNDVGEGVSVATLAR